MIKSPKEKFIETAHRLKHAETVATDAFQVACDYALLQMQAEMSDDPQKGFESHFQMLGAQRFIKTLKTIHEPAKEPVQPVRKTLNYSEGV